jgi:uncharacterized protein YecT (DUF1311 family)
MLHLLFLFFFAVHPAAAAGSDDPPKPEAARSQPCADAKTQLAINECFAKIYVEADAQLNVAYNKVINTMKGLLTDAQRRNDAPQVAHHQAAMDRLLAAQRAWLNYRDLHCDSVKFQYDGGSISPSVWSQCMAEATQQRIAALTADYDLTN